MAKIYKTAPHVGISNAAEASKDNTQRHSNKTVGIYDKPTGIHSPQVQRFWWGIAAVFILLLLVVGFLSLG